MLLYTHALEVHTEFATLYLRGILSGPDVALARATCARLPRSIRLLRLDVHGMHAIDAEAIEGITGLTRDWRRDRLGHLIISATPDDLELLTSGRAEPATFAAEEPAEPALMATYL